MKLDTQVKKNFLMLQKTTQLSFKLPLQQTKSSSGLMRLLAPFVMTVSSV